QDVTLESVEVVLNATHAFASDLEVVLTSPTGVKSILAANPGFFGENYDNWVFTTNRDWGESSKGVWTITVRDRSGGDTGTFNNFHLNFHGTAGPLFPPAGQITGTVFSDDDGDGTRDVGEAGLSGFTIYSDTNNNNILDSGEPAAISQPDGTYTLFS